MEIKQVEMNNQTIAVVNCDEVVIKDTQSALDFLMTVQYESGSHRIAVNKEAIAEDFFELRTRIAGEIMQKMVTYQFKFAVIGDYTGYTGKAWNDFMYESNNGKDIFFVSNEEQALEKLSK